MMAPEPIATAQLAPILRLARQGATDLATARLNALGAEAIAASADALTLKGRLLKDEAARLHGAARRACLDAAGAAYLASARLRPATYPLINAATLAFLADDDVRAYQMAANVLAMIDDGDHAPETPYWLAATRAEALLLQREDAQAQLALETAFAHAPRAFEDHAATVRQCAAILAHGQRDDGWLERFRPPPIIWFQGILGLDDALDKADGDAARLTDAVRALAPSHVCGALAAGADIIIGEAAVIAGAALHVILPAPVDLFVAQSVALMGKAWEGRFYALLGQAESLITLDVAGGYSPAAVALAARMAMGMAVRQAHLLSGAAMALYAGPQQPSDAAATLLAHWQTAGRPLQHVPVAASKAVPGGHAGGDQPAPLRFWCIDAQGAPQHVPIDDAAALAMLLASPAAGVRLCDVGPVGDGGSGGSSGGAMPPLLARLGAAQAGGLQLPVAVARDSGGEGPRFALFTEPAALCLLAGGLLDDAAQLQPAGVIGDVSGEVPVFSLRL